MKILFAGGLYAALLAAVLRWTDSNIGLVIFGVGTVLLLDRHFFRILPWPAGPRHKGLLLRGAYVVLIATLAYTLRPSVPLTMALRLGVAISLLLFLLEVLSGVLVGRLCRWQGRRRFLARAGVVVTLLTLLSPLLAVHPPRRSVRHDPAAYGMAFEDIQFTTEDDIELRGWLVPCAQARGNVIFCHGYGRNRDHVNTLLPTLHKLGLNVLAFDFRGHGESGGNTAAFGHREVADVRAAAVYLRARCPGKQLFLVGISFGAAVTLQTLPSLPDVRAVWVEGAFSRLENVVDNYFGSVPDPLRSGLVRFCSTLGWLDCGMWIPDVSPIEALQRVDVPIAFCHGTEDELIPFREGQALYAACHGPRECFWAEGAHHDNIRRLHRAEYMRRLQAFFARHVANQGNAIVRAAGPKRDR